MQLFINFRIFLVFSPPTPLSSKASLKFRQKAIHTQSTVYFYRKFNKNVKIKTSLPKIVNFVTPRAYFTVRNVQSMSCWSSWLIDELDECGCWWVSESVVTEQLLLLTVVFTAAGGWRSRVSDELIAAAQPPRDSDVRLRPFTWRSNVLTRV